MKTNKPSTDISSDPLPLSRENSTSIDSRPAKITAFQCTDAGNAELFAAMYKDDLRYDHNRRRWRIWSQHRWKEDNSGSVVQCAKRVARWRCEATKAIEDPDEWKRQFRWARASEMRARLDSMLKLAESEPQLSDSGAEWDSNPWLLGVCNGVVDLCTGQFRNGQRTDKITLATGVPFDPAARCPRFEKFLIEIFAGGHDLASFVQRAAGYCLTGDTSEQVIFLCCGTGANGKSTLLDTLRFVFGDYTYNLPFSAFELKARSSIANEIAALQGKRFITAIETNESVQLNEARIKALTGSDPITARFLYREFVTFNPTGKFWLAFNHRPAVSDDSPGFWRRIRLIPFLQQFSEGKRESDLMRKLKAEAAGILNWAIQGALMWQAKGLKAPQVVLEQSEKYREESDSIGEFFEDRCIVSPPSQMTVEALWSAYREWAASNEERPLNRRTFVDRMSSRGFKRGRHGHDRTRIWLGVRLKSEPISATPGARADADVRIPLLIN
jgi:putative DNA primase/helicase